MKEGGFGSAQALYQNFVKFLSISPVYHLTNFEESDKTNKVSFKERCNLLREVFSNLYSGINNDEAVTFHKDLINSYSESLSFVLLKRVVPLFNSTAESKEEDLAFAMA